jgi:hypothetical protein
MTGFVLVSFSGRVLVVQEVLSTMKHNIQTNVDENITKARRSAYSLFGCGFHGHNGLDPESLLHIYTSTKPT